MVKGFAKRRERIQKSFELDVWDVCLVNGRIGELEVANPARYETAFECTLPFDEFGGLAGDYTTSVNGKSVSISLYVMEEPSDDEIREYLTNPENKRPYIETSTLPNMPIDYYLDNRTDYPAVRANIVLDGLWGINLRQMDWQGTKPRETLRGAKSLMVEALNSLPAVQENPKLRLRIDDFSTFGTAITDRQTGEMNWWRLSFFTTDTAFTDAAFESVGGGLADDPLFMATADAFASQKVTINSEADLKKVILQFISNVLVQHIEKRRWIQAFWDGAREFKGETIPARPKREPEIQPTLGVLFQECLRPMGINVVAESDEGSGELDFRFCYTTAEGAAINVALECKLAHHKKIKHGINRQLPAYMDSIPTTEGIFLVIWFKDEKGKYFSDPAVRTLQEMRTFLEGEAGAITGDDSNSFNVDAVVVDASIRPSASKA